MSFESDVDDFVEIENEFGEENDFNFDKIISSLEQTHGISEQNYPLESEVECLRFEGTIKNRTKQYYINDGFIYIRNMQKHGNLYIKCIEPDCLSTAQMSVVEGNFHSLRLNRPHNHDQKINLLHNLRLKHSLYTKSAMGESTFCQLYEEELEKFPMADVSRSYLKRRFRLWEKYHSDPDACEEMPEESEIYDEFPEELMNNCDIQIASCSNQNLETSEPNDEMEFEVECLRIGGTGKSSGTRYYISDGFIYVRNTQKHGTLYMMCMDRNCKSSARIARNKDNFFSLRVLRPHNHDRKMNALHNLRLKHSLYKKSAMGESCFHQLYEEETKKFPEADVNRTTLKKRFRLWMAHPPDQEICEETTEELMNISDIQIPSTSNSNQNYEIESEVECLIIGGNSKTRFKQYYISNGFIYLRNMQTHGNLYMKCMELDCKSTAKMSVDEDNFHSLRVIRPHNHDQKINVLHNLRLKHSLYTKSTIRESKFRHLYEEEIKKFPNADVNRTHLRRYFYEWKKCQSDPETCEEMPEEPDICEEVPEELMIDCDYQIASCSNQNFETSEQNDEMETKIGEDSDDMCEEEAAIVLDSNENYGTSQQENGNETNIEEDVDDMREDENETALDSDPNCEIFQQENGNEGEVECLRFEGIGNDRGKRYYANDGFVYFRNTSLNGYFYMRCIDRDCKSTARVSGVEDNFHSLKMMRPHNHDRKINVLHNLRLKHSLYKKAAMGNFKFRHLYEEEIKKFPKADVSRYYLMRGFSRRKDKSDPSTREEIPEELMKDSDNHIASCSNQNFETSDQNDGMDHSLFEKSGMPNFCLDKKRSNKSPLADMVQSSLRKCARFKKKRVHPPDPETFEEIPEDLINDCDNQIAACSNQNFETSEQDDEMEIEIKEHIDEVSDCKCQIPSDSCQNCGEFQQDIVIKIIIEEDTDDMCKEEPEIPLDSNENNGTFQEENGNSVDIKKEVDEVSDSHCQISSDSGQNCEMIQQDIVLQPKIEENADDMHEDVPEIPLNFDPEGEISLQGNGNEKEIGGCMLEGTSKSTKENSNFPQLYGDQLKMFPKVVLKRIPLTKSSRLWKNYLVNQETCGELPEEQIHNNEHQTTSNSNQNFETSEQNVGIQGEVECLWFRHIGKTAGKRYYINDGFIYLRNRESLGRYYMKCNEINCNGSVLMSAVDGKFYCRKMIHPHNHDRKITALHNLRFSHSLNIKSAIKGTIFDQLYDEESKKFPMADIRCKLLRRRFNKWKKHQPDTETCEEVPEELMGDRNPQTASSSNQNFETSKQNDGMNHSSLDEKRPNMSPLADMARSSLRKSARFKENRVHPPDPETFEEIPGKLTNDGYDQTAASSNQNYETSEPNDEIKVEIKLDIDEEVYDVESQTVSDTDEKCGTFQQDVGFESEVECLWFRHIGKTAGKRYYINDGFIYLRNTERLGRYYMKCNEINCNGSVLMSAVDGKFYCRKMFHPHNHDRKITALHNLRLSHSLNIKSAIKGAIFDQLYDEESKKFPMADIRCKVLRSRFNNWKKHQPDTETCEEVPEELMGDRNPQTASSSNQNFEPSKQNDGMNHSSLDKKRPNKSPLADMARSSLRKSARFKENRVHPPDPETFEEIPGKLTNDGYDQTAASSNQNYETSEPNDEMKVEIKLDIDEEVYDVESQTVSDTDEKCGTFQQDVGFESEVECLWFRHIGKTAGKRYYINDGFIYLRNTERLGRYYMKCNEINCNGSVLMSAVDGKFYCRKMIQPHNHDRKITALHNLRLSHSLNIKSAIKGAIFDQLYDEESKKFPMADIRCKVLRSRFNNWKKHQPDTETCEEVPEELMGDRNPQTASSSNQNFEPSKQNDGMNHSSLDKKRPNKSPLADMARSSLRKSARFKENRVHPPDPETFEEIPGKLTNDGYDQTAASSNQNYETFEPNDEMKMEIKLDIDEEVYDVESQTVSDSDEKCGTFQQDVGFESEVECLWFRHIGKNAGIRYYINDGFIYLRNTESLGRYYMKCNEINCNGSVVMSAVDGKFYCRKMIQPHNHDRKITALHNLRLSHFLNIKSAIKGAIFDQLYDEESKKFPMADIGCKSLRSRFNKWKKHQPDTETCEEVPEELMGDRNPQTASSSNENFETSKQNAGMNHSSLDKKMPNKSPLADMARSSLRKSARFKENGVHPPDPEIFEEIPEELTNDGYDQTAATSNQNYETSEPNDEMKMEIKLDIDEEVYDVESQTVSDSDEKCGTFQQDVGFEREVECLWFRHIGKTAGKRYYINDGFIYLRNTESLGRYYMKCNEINCNGSVLMSAVDGKFYCRKMIQPHNHDRKITALHNLRLSHSLNIKSAIKGAIFDQLYDEESKKFPMADIRCKVLRRRFNNWKKHQPDTETCEEVPEELMGDRNPQTASSSNQNFETSKQNDGMNHSSLDEKRPNMSPLADMARSSLRKSARFKENRVHPPDPETFEEIPGKLTNDGYDQTAASSNQNYETSEPNDEMKMEIKLDIEEEVYDVESQIVSEPDEKCGTFQQDVGFEPKLEEESDDMCEEEAEIALDSDPNREIYLQDNGNEGKIECLWFRGTPIYSGKRYYINDGFIYVRSASYCGNLYLMCMESKCKGTAKISGDEDNFHSFTLMRPHNHDRNINVLHNLRLKYALYKKSTMRESSFEQSYEEELSKFPKADVCRRYLKKRFLLWMTHPPDQETCGEIPEELMNNSDNQIASCSSHNFETSEQNDGGGIECLWFRGTPIYNGKRYYINDGFIYVRSASYCGNLYLMCMESNCKSTAKISGDEDNFHSFTLMRPHNHDRNINVLHNLRLKYALYKKSTMRESSFEQSYEEELSKFPKADVCRRYLKKRFLLWKTHSPDQETCGEIPEELMNDSDNQIASCSSHNFETSEQNDGMNHSLFEKSEMPNFRQLNRKRAKNFPLADILRSSLGKSARFEEKIVHPPDPETFEEIHEELMNNELYSSHGDGNQYYLGFYKDDNGDGSLVFLSQLTKVLRSSKLHVENKFDVLPPSFCQLLTVHGWYGNALYPLGYALMQSKTVSAYVGVFEKLKICLDLNPESIVTNFDEDQRSALRRVFPNTPQLGCVFQYCQWLAKKAQDLGLLHSISSNTKSRAKSLLQMHFALPLLPSILISRGFSVIKEEMETGAIPALMENKIREFSDYVETCWLNRVPAEVLSVKEETNEVVDPFLRMLKKAFSGKHPNVIVWAYVVKVREVLAIYQREFENRGRVLPMQGNFRFMRTVNNLWKQWGAVPDEITAPEIAQFLKIGGDLYNRSFFTPNHMYLQRSPFESGSNNGL